METGFAEELKEKYTVIKGEPENYEMAKDIMIGGNINRYGFEGLCLSADLEKLDGVDIATETPTLSQICINIMKKYSELGK